MHQTVANVLRTRMHAHPPQNAIQAEQLMDNALATAMHATRAAVSRVLGTSPGALAFHRDMFLNIPLLADLQTIRDKRQVLINENLRRQNLKRRTWDYEVNQQVMIKESDPTKLGQRTTGPFPITRVHANGTLTIRLSPHITERMNIRRLVPYRQ